VRFQALGVRDLLAGGEGGEVGQSQVHSLGRPARNASNRSGAPMAQSQRPVRSRPSSLQGVLAAPGTVHQTDQRP
jgi:hypothetical protein